MQGKLDRITRELVKIEALSNTADANADANRDKLAYYEKVYTDLDDSMSLPRDRWTQDHKDAHTEALSKYNSDYLFHGSQLVYL